MVSLLVYPIRPVYPSRLVGYTVIRIERERSLMRRIRAQPRRLRVCPR